MNQIDWQLYRPFRPAGPLAGYRQAAAFLREAIQRGALRPGDRLPSVRQLAACWQLKPSMVTRALKLLEEERKLRCNAKVGTFVEAPGQALRSVGIYLTRRLNELDFRFYALLTVTLQQQLEQRGTAGPVFYDDRPAAEQNTPYPRLTEAIQDGRIDSLIVLMTPQPVRGWLKCLGIPLVARGENRLPFVLDWNFRAVFDPLLEHCRERGARSVGLLTHVSRGCHADGSPRIAEQFIAGMEAHSLSWREAWITSPERELDTGLEHYGYLAAKRLFSGSELPDALILYPDVVARGAVAAILEYGYPIERLQLLIHRHRELDFLVPFPCTFFDNPVSDIAERTIEALTATAGPLPDHDRYWLLPNPLTEKG